jgi:hypothetical protein
MREVSANQIIELRGEASVKRYAGLLLPFRCRRAASWRDASVGGQSGAGAVVSRRRRSSSVGLFAQMMFADQVYRTRLRSFFTELFCETHF